MTVAPIVKYASKTFTLPVTCVRLRGLLDDPKADNADLAKVMSLDPSLSAKVLKLANSALFRFPSEISSVQKALCVIGGEAAYNISMAETANRAFQSFNTSLINFDQFWHKAVLNGVMAKSLAQQLKMRGSERFFALGIMQNLSELVCANYMPEKYSRYQDAKQTAYALHAQQDIFGCTFTKCSGLILKAWSLPEVLWSPLEDFEQFDDKLNTDASILYLATIMTELEEGSDVITHPYVSDSLLEQVGLTQDDYDIIHEFATAESLKVVASLK